MAVILVLTADAAFLEKVRRQMGEGEYTLLHAAAAGEGFSRLEREPVDFVLYDAQLVLAEGVEHLLRMKEEYPRIPVVTCSPLRGAPE